MRPTALAVLDAPRHAQRVSKQDAARDRRGE
jgi:hypothetical protein